MSRPCLSPREGKLPCLARDALESEQPANQTRAGHRHRGPDRRGRLVFVYSARAAAHCEFGVGGERCVSLRAGFTWDAGGWSAWDVGVWVSGHVWVSGCSGVCLT